MGLFLYLVGSVCAQGEPPAVAVSGFTTYVGALESRLALQHRSADGFLAAPASDPQTEARLRRGELVIEELTRGGGVGLPGALLHDWRGTAFVPGAKAADFERVMRDFDSYPRRFSPQVVQARVLLRQGDPPGGVDAG